ncbi:hypothetical protein DFP72DRAFT_1066327 [Ephemerocybe angulata]|uniref:Uncharacterized protein n=1 Tax=Ephemerocybe angulata TaxID=980116 RepID=A0A8H6I2Y5_9AGAR|nr:hypothetical protein DFP72DRAFT_1066327 [Tulosesus angulatus]
MVPRSSHRLFVLASLFMVLVGSEAGPIEPQSALLTARQVGVSCSPLGAAELQKLAAWPKIIQYALSLYGSGGVNIVTNPADVCLHLIHLTEDRRTDAWRRLTVSRSPGQYAPQCSTASNEIHGTIDGTTGKVTFQSTGTSQTSSWTVTRTSSLTTGVSFTVSIGIPRLGLGAEIGTYVESTITDERSTTFSTTFNNMQSTSLEFDQSAGQACKATIETLACVASGSGKVPIVMSGFVWFNYEDRRAPLADPNGDQHYKYSIPIDSVLTEEERTTFIEFQGPTHADTTSTQYAADCGTPGA